ncbi:transketolase [Sulfurospirillum oryzae]|uniref:transketolase n=1 Tax=Sulfurospirillum oryzae TaxID=2976535 RepID=UPI0021E711D6|nr:transketolase [Sulfurospirillum oryzae]
MLKKQADTIRFLAADMVQSANSGHPGAPMGLADIVTILARHITHNPKNPKWLNRDRLVFSGGHASALVYSFLHLTGYDISIDDLKNFRQLGSKTPGHPEYGDVPGVEVTTGPLGQGISNAVGFAMAAKYAATLLNAPKAEVITHKVYCLCGDGDLQEGISYEACSLAGHLSLDNLVVIYDSNAITIEGDTSIAWSEDVKQRFEAQGWEVSRIDGHDFDEINAVLEQAKEQTKPYLIIADTTIAKGACEMEGSHHAHGAPLGCEEIKNSKIKAGFDPEKSFSVDEDVYARFNCALEKGDLAEAKWNALIKNDLKSDQKALLEALLNPDFSKIEWPNFEGDVATRDSNGKILNAIAKAIPSFLGGSADLGPSNKSELNGMGDYPLGRNIHFGIREHAMGAIINAFALYGLFIPFGATFFIFSDYMKPSVRLAALMKLKNFYIWTHDSIGVGEDGPTHQPIEQLSQFRALPNFYVYRPCDGRENVKAWQKALSMQAPAAFVCSRQKLKALKDERAYGDVENGGYLLTKRENATLTLMASGSEVYMALQVGCMLTKMGVATNIVSVPCFDLLIEQDKAYIDTIIDPKTKVVAIEASAGLEWYRFADEVIGMKRFGASAPAELLFDKFGLTPDTVTQKVCVFLGINYQKSSGTDCKC